MNGKLQGHWSVWMPVYPWTVKVQPSGLIRSQSSQISQVYILLKTVTVSSGSTPTCSFVHYKQKDMGKKKTNHQLEQGKGSDGKVIAHLTSTRT